MEVAYIADDLGLDDSVNEAIVHSHTRGVLQGAGLMMGQPGTAAAVAMARDLEALEIGWHLHLNDSVPCTRRAWPWGPSPSSAGVALGLSKSKRRVAHDEIRCQWDAFQETGLTCRFVNAHHHIHVHPFVRETLLAVLEDGFDGWIRWGSPRFFERDWRAPLYHGLDLVLQSPHRTRIPHRTSTTIWGLGRTFAMQASEVAAVLPGLGDGLHEFMFHPRRADESDPDTRCLLELKTGSP